MDAATFERRYAHVEMLYRQGRRPEAIVRAQNLAKESSRLPALLIWHQLVCFYGGYANSSDIIDQGPRYEGYNNAVRTDMLLEQVAALTRAWQRHKKRYARPFADAARVVEQAMHEILTSSDRNPNRHAHLISVRAQLAFVHGRQDEAMDFFAIANSIWERETPQITPLWRFEHLWAWYAALKATQPSSPLAHSLARDVSDLPPPMSNSGIKPPRASRLEN